MRGGRSTPTPCSLFTVQVTPCVVCSTWLHILFHTRPSLLQCEIGHALGYMGWLYVDKSSADKLLAAGTVVHCRCQPAADHSTTLPLPGQIGTAIHHCHGRLLWRHRATTASWRLVSLLPLTSSHGNRLHGWRRIVPH